MQIHFGTNIEITLGATHHMSLYGRCALPFSLDWCLDIINGNPMANIALDVLFVRFYFEIWWWKFNKNRRKVKWQKNIGM